MYEYESQEGRSARRYGSLLKSLTGMDALVRVETGFLRETFEAQVALERPFPSVCAHVHLEVRLTTESRVAHLRTTIALLYNLAFTAGGFLDPNDPT